MTREEWLRHAVEQLDITIFNGDLDLLNHNFQIACGRCPGQKLTECIQPYDGEDVKLDDFFPTTISVNFTIKDPIEMLGALALECIHAFFNEKKCNKRFKILAEKYYFIKPFTSYNPSDHLIDLLEEVYNKLVKNYGEFPGQPVVFYKKEKKDSPKRSFKVFCPECGYEMKVTKKILDAHANGLPTCACGVKMIIEEDEEITKS